MKKSAKQASFLSALALMIVVVSAANAETGSSSNDSELFQMTEIGHIQVAASEEVNVDANASVEHKNRLMNNKFTEKVCAAHVFHPKRKHAEAMARKNGDKKCANKQCSSKSN